MPQDEATEAVRLPGLFRVFDLTSVLHAGADYELFFTETAADGAPLFAVFRRPLDMRPQDLERLQ